MSTANELIFERLGLKFKNHDLLQLALTHKSYANEALSVVETNPGQSDNERFEFLGDAVLSLALSEILVGRFPKDPEGALSKKRASLVNEETLAQVARELNLDQVLKLGKGEAKSGGLQKPRILASTFEAVLGAIFLDSGYLASLATVDKVMSSRLDAFAGLGEDFVSDFKSRLQEKIQGLQKSAPTYAVESEEGPDHDKIFKVSVRVGDAVLALGSGKSKKSAEQDAARVALEDLK